jgi:hypothetical protein
MTISRSSSKSWLGRSGCVFPGVREKAEDNVVKEEPRSPSPSGVARLDNMLYEGKRHQSRSSSCWKL